MMVEIKLFKKPKNPIIIDGFPGFGMVGTIATEFLIEHLKTEQIGKILLPEMPALLAIHEGKLIEPFGIFYNKQYNIIIVHAVGGGQGTEWLISDVILKIAKELEAREIISLEGVGSADGSLSENPKTFYLSNKEEKNKILAKLKLQQLTEGIIMGVTSALLLKADDTLPITCLFAETHSQLPDSKAAAEIIKALDNYLGLKVDYKPLLTMAVKFEDKLKHIVQQKADAEEQRDKKELNYVG